MGGFSRKGLNYFGQSKSNEIGLSPILPRMAKIGKNHFLPHSITLAYEEVKCIFVEVILNTKWFFNTI
jgi:hypothetical protein